MNTIYNAIAALLYDHETVIVPGLGAFLRHAEGAKANVITNQFERPSSTLGFDPQQREENDLLVRYLVNHEGLSEEEAKQQLALFVSDCFAKLRSGGTMEIPEVGTLSFDGNQELVFEAVDASNFNGDAFGLSDLNPKPVYGSERQEDWKEQVKRQIKDQNTPMTVELLREEGDKHKERHGGWIWWLLLLLAAAGVALWYFKFRPVTSEPVPTKPFGTIVVKPKPVPMISDTIAIISDTLKNPSDTLEMPDTLAIPTDPVILPKSAMEVIVPPDTAKVFIVGGCFSVEQNALNMAATAREQGCADAFVMRRGTMFYVCYGHFPTMEDAKAALGTVLENYNKKAWILKK